MTVKLTDGYYAIELDGVIKFYRFHNGTGANEGYEYLEAQASDEYWYVKDRDTRTKIINLIKQDPLKAQLLYAKELGKCYKCGRILTNEVSRQRGVGPICWSRQ